MVDVASDGTAASPLCNVVCQTSVKVARTGTYAALSSVRAKCVKDEVAVGVTPSPLIVSVELWLRRTCCVVEACTEITSLVSIGRFGPAVGLCGRPCVLTKLCCPTKV